MHPITLAWALGLMVATVEILPASEDAELSAWFATLDRRAVISVVFGRHDEFIMSHAGGLIADLSQPKPALPPVLRCYVAWRIYSAGSLTYEQAARVLAVIKATTSGSDTGQSDDALTAFIQLFPRATLDQDIRKLAESNGLHADEDAWANAFWLAEIGRGQDAGSRRTLVGPMRRQLPQAAKVTP